MMLLLTLIINLFVLDFQFGQFHFRKRRTFQLRETFALPNRSQEGKTTHLAK
jgi:CRISPR-associated Cas5-like protein